MASLNFRRFSIGKESMGNDPLKPKPWLAYIWWECKKTGHRKLERYNEAELWAENAPK